MSSLFCIEHSFNILLHDFVLYCLRNIWMEIQSILSNKCSFVFEVLFLKSTKCFFHNPLTCIAGALPSFSAVHKLEVQVQHYSVKKIFWIELPFLIQMCRNKKTNDQATKYEWKWNRKTKKRKKRTRESFLCDRRRNVVFGVIHQQMFFCIAWTTFTRRTNLKANFTIDTWRLLNHFYGHFQLDGFVFFTTIQTYLHLC